MALLIMLGRMMMVVVIMVVFDWVYPLVTSAASEPLHSPNLVSPLHSNNPTAQLFDDTIIVKFNESLLKSVTLQERIGQMKAITAELVTKYGLSSIRTLPILGTQLFKLNTKHLLKDQNAAILELRKNPAVQYAEYNWRTIATQAPSPKDPNDPQWADGYFWGLRKIGMREAWGYHTDASNIVVAVIDSGIDYAHQDLEPNMWTDSSTGSHGFDFCTDTATPTDSSGHGTMVGGVIGARGNDSYGAVGASWRVKLLALKFLCGTHSTTGLPSGSMANAIEAIDYAMSKDAMIINNSWRIAPPVYASDIQTLKDAVLRTNCEGRNVPVGCKPALFVVAAGNALPGESLNSDSVNGKVYPASFVDASNLIAVAATECSDPPECTDKLWGESHYGPQTVHIAAPGADIDSTSPAALGGAFSVLSGTSMAAPHVSGCAALLQARNFWWLGRFLSVAEVKNLLFSNADTPFQGSIIEGRRLNCSKAMAAIQRRDVGPPPAPTSLRITP